jgi:hypothetical protein
MINFSNFENERYIKITYEWLVNKFPDFSKVNLESKSNLLCGKPQCGKSQFCFGVALMLILMKKSCIFILRNYKQDVNHMKAKLLRFSDEHVLYMKSIKKEKFTEFSTLNFVDTSILKSEGGVIVNSEKLLGSLCGKNKKLVLLISNGTQLSNINKILTDYNISYVLFTDEADAIGYSEIKDVEEAPDKHAALEYSILKENAFQSYEITATVWDVLTGNSNLKNVNIVSIRPPPTYKGISDGIQFKVLEFPILKWKSGCIFEEDPNLFNVYTEMTNTPIFKKSRYNCAVNHPIICIHKTRREINHHEEFYKAFRKHYIFGKLWTILTECEKGIKIYSQSLKDFDKMIINNHKFKIVNGETILSKNIIVPEILQWFVDNGGAEKFHHIVIKSGDFSGRSRSYVSTNGVWHLTHQYYKGSSTLPNMIQAQRILHDRPDSIPLIEYAPKKVILDLQNGDKMQDEQLERLQFSSEEVFTKEQVREEVWNKKKVPKVKLCVGKVNLRFKVKKSPTDDGGWQIEKYSINMIDDAINKHFENMKEYENKGEKGEKEEYPISEYNRLKNLIPKWVKEDSPMGKLIRELKIDINKIYTRNEIIDLCERCGKKISLLTQKSKQRDDYILLVNDCKYQIHPFIKELF